MVAAGTSQVVICGAGVIGASTAYFLSLRHGVKPLIIEAGHPACSSSGKAGGFLALDWCDGSPVGILARRSFELHAQLAQTMGIDYGYRRLKTHSLQVNDASKARRKAASYPGLPDWVSQDFISSASQIGTEETTAQVHPEKFTQALIAKACERGAEVRTGKVVGLQLDAAQQKVVGVQVESSSGSEVIPADVVVLALGAWSSILSEWFSNVPAVTGQKAHSIVLADPEQRTSPDALFLTYKTARDKNTDPEIYPRPNGEVYVCGVPEGAPLPESALEVVPTEGSCERLKRVATTMTKHLGQAPLLREQACFLPISEDGLPIIGRVPQVEGAYVATGHSCWGILNAPATGAALAELIVDGVATTVSLAAFDPARGSK